MSALENLKQATSLRGIAAALGYQPSGLSYIVYTLGPQEKYIKFDIPKRGGGVAKFARRRRS